MINKLELLTNEPVVHGTMKSHGSKYKLPKNAKKQIVGYRQEKICYERSQGISYSLSTYTMYKIEYDVR